MGDDFELNEYQRKTKLVCAEESLHNDYRNVEPGEKRIGSSPFCSQKKEQICTEKKASISKSSFFLKSITRSA